MWFGTQCHTERVLANGMVKKEEVVKSLCRKYGKVAEVEEGYARVRKRW